MTMTLLQICQEALRTTTVAAPSSIVASTAAGQKLLSLANTTGKDIASRYDWEALKQEATFTTIAPATQFAMATEYPELKKIVEKTMWNRTRQERVFGPLNAEAWQRIQAVDVAPPSLYYRIRGGSLLLAGTWDAGETIAFEFISKEWVSNATSTNTFEAFQANDDYPLVDDQLMVLGVRWRYRESIGMEYAEAFRDYEMRLETLIGDDAERETLSLTRRRSEFDLGTPNADVTITTNSPDFSDTDITWN